jgi:hypothetical protein
MLNSMCERLGNISFCGCSGCGVCSLDLGTVQ